MFPLPPPNSWSKLQSAVSKFIWKKRRPCLKMSTLQRRENGGLALPNFKFYSWSFVLRLLLFWFDSHTPVSWCALECNLVDPWTLRDVLFVNISKKQCQLRLGPIILHLIQTWSLAKAQCHISCKWHTFSPLFNNKALLIGGRPIWARQWEHRGVHYFRDIFNDCGLLSFSDIKDAFNLLGSSFFFYLQLRSALNAYGVPWQCPLPIHPIRDLFTKSIKTKGMVSKLYQFLLQSDLVSLPVESLETGLPRFNPGFWLECDMVQHPWCVL